MKNIKYLLFLLLLLPLNVFGYEVSLSCASTIKENDTFKCTIYSPTECNEISMTLVLPDGFTLKNNKPSSSFKSTSEGNNLSYKLIGNVVERELTVLTIQTPSEINSSNVTIELTNIKYKPKSTSTDYTTLSNESSSIKVQTTTTKNNDNYVLTLDPNNGTDEEQTLSCTPHGGTCEIDLTSINTPTKDGYTFNGWSEDRNCTEGETSKLKLSQSKIVYACYKDNIIKTAHLENIEIKGYTINYNSQVLEYSINVPKETEINDIKITVTPYTNNAKAEISKPEVLKTGENIFNIIVTEKGETVTYTIRVFKETEPAPYLIDLFIEDYLLEDFSPTKYNYDLKINMKTKELKISPISNDLHAKIAILGNVNLDDGGVITITVTSTDEAQSVYTINVTVKTVWEQFKPYFIALGIIIFMFTVYFIVRHIKKQNGEIPSKHPIVKKEKKEKKKKKNDKVEELQTEETTEETPKEEVPEEILPIEEKPNKKKKEKKPLFKKKKKEEIPAEVAEEPTMEMPKLAGEDNSPKEEIETL